MSTPRTIRWGILGPGGIAKTFTIDLLVDPATRGVTHLKHTVVAAASASSVTRAQDFLRATGSPSDAKAYGSYEELVNDPRVDIVYVATPHSHHYQNAMLALEAGKPVLCEKAFTVNAKQLRELTRKAKEKDLFLMEAVWTRYFPLSIYVRDQITSGRIGPVARVFADNSFAIDPEVQYGDGSHRMVNPDLAGGALLDLGIYSLTWVFQTLYFTQREDARQPPQVLAAMKAYAPTQSADEATTIVLNFPRSQDAGGDAHAIATTSLRVATTPAGHQDVPGIRIQGPKGEIQVFPPAFRPTRTRLILKDGTVEDKSWPQPGPGEGSGWRNGFGGGVNAEGEGHGMFWEADEAADGIINGRKQGRYESLDESILIMEVMDEARRQGGLTYPEKIETTQYPTSL